jgi:hypothetical protein
VLRMQEAVDLESFNSLGDGIIDQIKAFAKGDGAGGAGGGIVDVVKGLLGKKDKAPAQPVYPPGYNPYLAPTATTGFNWLYVAVPLGVAGLGLAAWALLRKR